MQPIAIMCAMYEEVAGILELMEQVTLKEIGSRKYYCGKICNKDVVVTYSYWGKVAASLTATTLINIFNVAEIILIGVAGSLNNDLKIGDIIIGKDLYQHDFDPSPYVPKLQLPVINQKFITADLALSSFITDIVQQEIPNLAIWKHTPRCFRADIISGDQLFTTVKQKQTALKDIPSAYCVEMEGAAMAQVCADFKVRFAVIRAVSDDAEDISSFLAFTEKIWLKNAKHLVEAIIRKI